MSYKGLEKGEGRGTEDLKQALHCSSKLHVGVELRNSEVMA